MRIADYAHDNRFFEFDPTTGVYSIHKLDAPRKTRQGYCGIGQELRFKGQRKKILAAKYCEAGKAWLSLGAQRWPLFEPEVTLKHSESPLGWTCTFTVEAHGMPTQSFRYPRQDRLLLWIDTTYDHLDFVLQHLLSDVGDYDLNALEKHREEFLEMWCPERQRDA